MSQYQICVSGAAKGDSVEKGKHLAYESGKLIASRGHHLLTGATTGLPNFAAQGAKDERGMSIGLSPAANLQEHVNNYYLPTECYDIIFYTGQHFVGRDVMLVQSSDALISIGGRIGTTHEFTVAMELGKQVGVLHVAGGASELFKDLLHASGDAAYPPLVESDNAEELVDMILKILDDQQKEVTVLRQANQELRR